MHPLVGLSLSGNTLTPLDDLGSAPGHIGRPVWNARQLLSDLELRLGSPRGQVSRGARVQLWSKRLARVVADAGQAPPYFATAYRIDPTGTAAQLLRLRDELVDAGWDGEPLTGAERLETVCRLAAFGEPPLPPGRADHLAAVEAALERATSSPYVALDLADDLELWPGRWRRIFARLKALGTRMEPLRVTWPAPTGESDLARFQRALRGERMGEVRPPVGATARWCCSERRLRHCWRSLPPRCSRRMRCRRLPLGQNSLLEPFSTEESPELLFGEP